MSRCVEQCVVIISAVYLESKKEYLLLQNIPAAISGNFIFCTSMQYKGTFCGQFHLWLIFPAFEHCSQEATVCGF